MEIDSAKPKSPKKRLSTGPQQNLAAAPTPSRSSSKSELETQNAELRLALGEAEIVRERYTDLYDLAPTGLFSLLADGNIQMVNLAGAALVGIERSRLAGRSFTLLIRPSARAAFGEFLSHLFAHGGSASCDFELTRKGNPCRFVTIHAKRSTQGNECSLSVTDITDRKQAEDTWHRNDVLFTTLIGQLPIGVYVIDSEFRLRQANAPAIRSFGAIDNPIGKSFAEIVRYLWPKRVADSTLARFRHTFRTGEPYHSPDFAHRRHDIGVKQVYEWQIERVTLPGGELAVMCFFNNITARIQAERAEREIEVITASNLKLKKEIVRRQALEEVLRESRAEESRLLKQSRKHELHLRTLSHQILYIQEAERKRISRELHNIIAQTLVAINVNVTALAHDSNAPSAKLHQRIADTHRLVEHSVGIVHQFAQQLRPTALDDLGLIPALRTSLNGFTQETGIRVSLNTFAGIEEVPEIIRTAFFRIAQEALVNIAKYSKASAVEIRIEDLAGVLSMEISDNGQGFESLKTLAIGKRRRLGLIGMKERAEMIGGELSISSPSGAPTVIRVAVKAPATKKIHKNAPGRSQA